MYYAYVSLAVIIFRRNARKDPEWQKIYEETLERLRNNRNSAVWSKSDGRLNTW